MKKYVIIVLLILNLLIITSPIAAQTIERDRYTLIIPTTDVADVQAEYDFWYPNLISLVPLCISATPVALETEEEAIGNCTNVEYYRVSGRFKIPEITQVENVLNTKGIEKGIVSSDGISQGVGTILKGLISKGNNKNHNKDIADFVKNEKIK